MLALVLLNGCGTEDVQKSEDPTSQAFQQALVADLQPVAPRIVRSDPIEIGEPGEYAEPSWAKSGEVPADTPADDHRLVAHFGPSTGGRVQILEYDEQALEELAAALAGKGVAEAVAPPGAELDPAQEKGWSSNWFYGDGVDSRFKMSSLSNWELKTIGRLLAVGPGTGTLFGRRLVLTAAHVIIAENGTYVPGQFWANRKGTTTPYGKQNVVAAWWGGKYLQNCTCPSLPPGEECEALWHLCVPEDWALVLLQDSFPSGHPGWMGFAWLSEADITSFVKHSRGYPVCGETNSPGYCQTDYLYGQWDGCSIGQFIYPFPGGFNSAYWHGCDISAGQSGSGMYTTSLGSFHLFGVLSKQDCERCTFADQPDNVIRANPNVDKRLDSTIYNLMLNLRVSYP